jgi:hypothetical protein
MQESSKGLISLPLEHLLEQEDLVKIWIKPLNAEESELYIKKDLLKMGVQPVEIIIDNGSADPYYFSPFLIDLPLVEERDILKKLFYAALPRKIGFQIASLFFWPLTIPSTMDTMITHKAYRKLAKELSSKSIKEETIAPYSTVHRIFFVEKDKETGQFFVRLENEETLESRVFSVEKLSSDPQELTALPTPAENYYLTHEG